MIEALKRADDQGFVADRPDKEPPKSDYEKLLDGLYELARQSDCGTAVTRESFVSLSYFLARAGCEAAAHFISEGIRDGQRFHSPPTETKPKRKPLKKKRPRPKLEDESLTTSLVATESDETTLTPEKLRTLQKQFAAHKSPYDDFIDSILFGMRAKGETS